MSRPGYLQLVRHDWDADEHHLIGPRGPDVDYYIDGDPPKRGIITETRTWTPGVAVTTDGVGVVDAKSGDVVFVIPLRAGGGSMELRDDETVTVTPKPMSEPVRCSTCGATR